MLKKLIVTFFAITVMFCSPGYPEEISEGSPDNDISLEMALEWLKGGDLPERLKESLITIPLAKKNINQEKEKGERDPKSQIKAISHVFRQYNNKLDNTTASEYANIVKNASEKFGEDPFIIAALIVVESTVKANARSKYGDYGLMQVRWKVHKKKLTQKYPNIKTEKDMYKPLENITAGTEIFSSYRKSAEGDVIEAMKAYSGGGMSLWEKISVVMNQIEIKYYEFSNG
jgi:hypothetical protein